jgi:ABC-type antimicrobial peptide transport system permease subunit
MNKQYFVRSFILALQTFHKSKLRASLTVFGILVGIAMVVIVFAAGAGIRGMIMSQISSFGNNWINIEIKIPETGKMSQENARGIGQGVSITTLTSKDADRVKQLPNVEDTYSGLATQAVISVREVNKRPVIFGVSASYARITANEIAEGRFFTEEEDQSAASVLVLGSEIKNQIFGNQEAVGNFVKIDGQPFRVIGIFESIGTAGFIDMDSIVYLPIRTVQTSLMGIQHVSWIIAQVKNPAISESTAEEIRSIVRERHEITDPNKDDFSVTTMQESQAIVGNILNALTWLLVALAAISLAVGGVGIMNVMYVSVVERTFEIGLRKAMGATEKHILYQFLIEAVTMTLIGGLFGIVIGVSVSAIVAFAAQQIGYTWPFEISLFSIVLSVGFSTTIGVFFGLYPAKRAAALNPIVALQQE